jgi:hypothetical protein
MAFTVMILTACNNAASDKTEDIQAPNEQPAPLGGTDKKQNQQDNRSGVTDTTSIVSGIANNAPVTKGSNPDWDKKIIKTADMQLQLDNYKKFNSAIHLTIKQFGAYVADEKQTENDYKIENTLSIKVPVDQFDNLVNSFTGDGIKVMEKNVSSEDVTGEVVDTKARMQAKMAVRDKYLELLKQAKNMDEILQVQNEIYTIQENIEAANGRIDYLQHASAYSTVNLNYFQYINGNAAGDEKPDFFTKLSKAFSTGTSVVSNLFLFCISIWPLILGGIFIWLYLRKFKPKKA